jgi:hypothetical protein
MRAAFCVVGLLVLAQPAFAQTLLKSEPYHLAPFSVVYVDNGSCSVGQVLKVTGGVGAMHRKRICVTKGREEASLGNQEYSLITVTR